MKWTLKQRAAGSPKVGLPTRITVFVCLTIVHPVTEAHAHEDVVKATLADSSAYLGYADGLPDHQRGTIGVAIDAGELPPGMAELIEANANLGVSGARHFRWPDDGRDPASALARDEKHNSVTPGSEARGGCIGGEWDKRFTSSVALDHTLLPHCLWSEPSRDFGAPQPRGALLLLVQSSGSGTNDGGGRDRPGPPPQEAIDACDAKSDGDSCAFEGPRGNRTITGTCLTTPEGSVACVPEGAGGPPPRN